MYYITYDEETGEILGVYPEAVGIKAVPSPKMEITDEEKEILDNGYYIVQNGVLVESNPPAIIEPIDIPDVGSGGEDDTDNKNIDYQEVFTKLRDAYVSALILNDTALKKAIKNEYIDKLAEFRINNSLAGETVKTVNFCKICGSALIDNSCPKCGWHC